MRWVSLSLFAGALIVDIDDDASHRRIGIVGGQLDLRLVTVSHLKSTLSFGYGVAIQDSAIRDDGWMISFKIL